MLIDENTFSVARLLLLGCTALFLLYCTGKLFRPPTHRWIKASGITLVVLSIWSFPNFGFLHQPNFTPLHTWDVFHYFMGSKYLPELGYSRLYEATIVAGQEHNVFHDITHIRNLNSYDPQEVSTVDRSEVKARFSAERWREFSQDLSYFVPRIARWQKLFFDHGYNDPPPRALILHCITNFVSASDYSLLLLSGLDYVLITVALVALFRSFGFTVGVVATALFFLNYLARFNFIGGSIGRWDWIASLMLTACALRSGRPYLGGALLGYACLARIFPVLFAVPLLLKYLSSSWSRKSSEGAAPALLAAAAVTVLGLGATYVLFPNYTLFSEFSQRISAHAQNLFLNHIGLNQVLAFSAANWLHHPDLGLYIPRAAAQEALSNLWLGRSLAVIAVLLMIRPIARRSTVESLQYGALLTYLLTSPANYYYAFLVLFPITAGTSRGIHPVDLIKILLLIGIFGAAYLFELQSPEMLPLYYKISMQIGIFLGLALIFDLLRTFSATDTANFIELESADSVRQSLPSRPLPL